jgi:hypothetical protein
VLAWIIKRLLICPSINNPCASVGSEEYNSRASVYYASYPQDHIFTNKHPISYPEYARTCERAYSGYEIGYEAAWDQVRCEVQKFIMRFTNQFVNYAFDWLLLLQSGVGASISRL